MYNDTQSKVVLKDYNGVECETEDTHGCCLLPTTYELSKALDYCELISEASSERAVYIESEE